MRYAVFTEFQNKLAVASITANGPAGVIAKGESELGIGELGLLEADRSEFFLAAEEGSEPPTALTGCSNVWCQNFLFRGKIVISNIVLMERTSIERKIFTFLAYIFGGIYVSQYRASHRNIAIQNWLRNENPVTDALEQNAPALLGQLQRAANVFTEKSRRQVCRLSENHRIPGVDAYCVITEGQKIQVSNAR